MEAKNLFSIFIAVIMVGSIVGFTAFYSFPDQEAGSDQGEPQAPTAIDFIAEDVNATVFQMLPSIKIQAETLETDIIAVNNSVYSIEGVKRVRGSFQQSPYTVLGTGFVYVADISFDADLNSQHVLQSIRTETPLQNIGGSSFALVQLPKTVSMHSVDEALGLTREYAFSEDISEALIGIDSIEGDSLVVGITATFIGEQAANLMAFEQHNLTAAPVPRNALLEAQVTSLESKLLFDAKPPYSLLDSVSTLESEVRALGDVNNASVFFSAGEAKIYMELEGPVEEDVFSNLKAFVEDLNAELAEQDSLNASISFKEGISSQLFSEKKAAIEVEMQRLGIHALVEEEQGFFSGTAELESADSGQAGLAIKNLFESIGLEATIRQPGNISLQEIFDSDLDKVHSVQGGEALAFLFFGHSLGETVQVEVNYSLVRGLIDSISAEESQIGD